MRPRRCGPTRGKKGVAFLIEAVAILAERYPALMLNIIGDEPLRESLESLPIELSVQDKVHFIGSVLNEEVPDFLRATRISVMPSVVASSGDQEGLGLVAVEALGCGCAVVAFDLPAEERRYALGKFTWTAVGSNYTNIIAELIDDARTVNR